MRKRVWVTYLVLVVIVTITWNMAADHFKANTELFLSQLNQSNDISVSYDKISVTGFPLRIGTSIQGLKIRFATGKFLKAMPEAYFNQAFPELSSKDRAILFSLEHRSQFSGNVDVTRNLLANQVKIKFGNGTIVSKDHAGEKAIHSIGETLYTIQLKHLFNLNQLSIKDIQSLSVESKNVVLTDEKNNVLLSSKRMLFTLRDTAIKNQKVMYTLTAKEQETRINNDYVQWFTALESYKILYQMLGQPRTVDLTDTQNKKSDPIARLPSLFPGIQLTQAQIQFAIPHLHELGGIVLNRMVIV